MDGGIKVHVVIAPKARLAVDIIHVTYFVADVIVARARVGNDDVAVSMIPAIRQKSLIKKMKVNGI